MPFKQTKTGPLKIVTTNYVTGITTVTESGYYGSVITSNLRNSTRRVRPADLFAGATSYSAYQWSTSDGTYTIPHKISPSAKTIQPCALDSSVLSGFFFEAPSTVGVQSRLRSKIKSQNVNLAQSMAEYRQTSKMFSSLAKDVFRTYQSLRSGRAFADFVRILQRPRTKNEQSVANRWLQYQYGLKPLMSDLYGVTDALATKIRDGMYIYVRSRTTETKFHSQKTGHLGTDVFRVINDIGGVARYKVSDPTMKMVSQLGISNPLLLAWELIPYSFVVDWMFPVGKFLSSLDALNGTSDLRAVTFSFEKHRYVYTAASGGTAHFEGIRYSRSTSSSLALPKLSYKPSSSLTAVANGLALLTQLRHR